MNTKTQDTLEVIGVIAGVIFVGFKIPWVIAWLLSDYWGWPAQRWIGLTGWRILMLVGLIAIMVNLWLDEREYRRKIGTAFNLENIPTSLG